MYTISEAARRAGVSVQVLRAWERRYGVVAPGRTDAGYRIYDDEAIARLRAVRRLVEDGWTPSRAAARIRDEGVAPAAAQNEPERPAETVPTQPLVDGFVDAAAGLDQAALGRVLDEMFASGSFERVTNDLLLPALRSLGRAWASGHLPVAAEHAASHAVLRRLSAAFEAAGTGRDGEDGRTVLVGLPPGSRHELGALAFAVAARRVGLPVLYLGPDLPVDEWLRAVAGHARSRGPAAAVVAVPTAADVPAARDVTRALETERPDLLLAVGGRGAEGAAERDERVVRLPDAIPDAAVALRDRLSPAPGPRRRRR